MAYDRSFSCAMEHNNPQSPNSDAEQLTLFAQEATPAPQKRPWLWLILSLAIAGSSFTIWRVFAPAGKPQAANAQAQGGPPPRPVETTPLQIGQAETRVQLIGQVEATQRSTIRSLTRGVVREILVEAGDRVTSGMAIAVLDDSDQALAVAEAQAQLAQQRSNLARLEVGTRPEIIAQRQGALEAAQAREREAQDNLKRTKDLVKEGALSERLLVQAQTAVDEARGERLEAQAELAEAQAGPIREEIDAQRANVSAANAALNQAQLNRQRTQVIATTSGVVQSREVSQGDLVDGGTAIVNLIGNETLNVFLEVPENLTSQVRPGMAVELTSRALPRWRQRATITAIAPSADSTSRRQRVRVELTNPPEGLLAGMAVEASLIQSSNRQGYIVSRDVLTQRRDQWFVFVIEDNKAKPIQVEMVADMGERVAIMSRELQAGQAIVSRGGDGLQEGTPVRVIER